MSEPVTTEDSWASAIRLANHYPTLPLINEHTDSSQLIFPHVNERYVGIYNKNGRVGMYTKDVRHFYRIQTRKH